MKRLFEICLGASFGFLIFTSVAFAGMSLNPKAAVVLVPGTFGNALPGSVHQGPEGQVSYDPYFSQDIITAFESKGIAVHVVKGLDLTGAFTENGRKVLEDTEAWYQAKFPSKDVPVVFVGHSCGGFYALQAANLNRDLPLKRIIMVSTPLEGDEIADGFFENAFIGPELKAAVDKASRWIDLRGLLGATTQGVASFLGSTRIPEELDLVAVGGFQRVSMNPFAAMDTENIFPWLVPTSLWIGGDNDGVVSLSSSLGRKVHLQTFSGRGAFIRTVPKLFVQLDHGEQVLDWRIFAAFGMRHANVIQKEQVRVYGAIADQALLK